MSQLPSMSLASCHQPAKVVGEVVAQAVWKRYNTPHPQLTALGAYVSLESCMLIKESIFTFGLIYAGLLRPLQSSHPYSRKCGGMDWSCTFASEIPNLQAPSI